MNARNNWPPLDGLTRYNVRAFTVAVSLLLSVSSFSRADVIFTFSGGNATNGQNFTYGFEFTPVVDIIVDSLGFYDADQNGLVASHRAGIWTSSGTLLASTTITNGTSNFDGPVIHGGRYRFTPIAELPLAAGTTYIFGAAVEGVADSWYFGGTNISNAPSLAVVSATGVFEQGDFVFPDRTIGNRYAAGSFTARAVPEPASSALLLIGAWLALRTATRTRRRND